MPRPRHSRPTPAGVAALRRAGVAVALTAAAWALGYRDLGLGPRRAGAGARWGIAVAAPVLAGYAAAAAVPALRDQLATPPPASREWLLVRIPLGTVLAEELLFRAVLDAVATRWLGRSGAVLVGSALFGLWHRKDGAGWPTIACTAASGVPFLCLRHGSGSLVAPVLLHLAVNAGGAGLRIYGAGGFGARFTTA
ncbi:MAG TPA: CPBP family intramembrane glutamic endopeptidase [Aldersonia sp.]